MSEPEIVLPGYKIHVELIDRSGDREKLTVQIVPDAFADLARGFIGEGTPLCQAIYGKAVGGEIDYIMGEIRAVKVISVTPTEDVADSSVAQRRAETLKKAVDQSDRTNAILFASSYRCYNGLGDRVSQTVNGVTTYFVLDLARGLTQVLEDGVNSYLYGNARIAQYTAGAPAYFVGDALGSVRQLADVSGAVTLSNSYKPYGEVLYHLGSNSTYGYTGEWTDNTGLINLRSRSYSPYLNQFIQPDPILPDPHVPGDWNRYVYSRDNPINLTDPSGKTPCLFPDEMPLCYSKLISLKDYARNIKQLVTSGTIPPVEGLATFVDRAYLLFDRDLQGMMWGTTNVLMGVDPNQYPLVWVPIVVNAYAGPNVGNPFYIGQHWLPYKNNPELDEPGNPHSLQGDWKDEYWDKTPNQAYHFWFYVIVSYHDGPEWAYTANEAHDGDWRGNGAGVSQEDYDLAIKGIDFGWDMFKANMLGLFGCDNTWIPAANPGAWIRANLQR